MSETKYHRNQYNIITIDGPLSKIHGGCKNTNQWNSTKSCQITDTHCGNTFKAFLQMNDFTNFSSSKSNAELGSEIILKKTSGSIGVALEILGGRGPLLVRGKIAGNNFGAVKTGLQ